MSWSNGDMIKYLKRKFEEVDKQLDEIKEEIKEIKEIDNGKDNK